jgi:hypothetical protein
VKVHAHQRDQIMAYGTRVKARPQTFSFQAKRFTLPALEMTVRWSAHADLSINGVIPVGTLPAERLLFSPSKR